MTATLSTITMWQALDYQQDLGTYFSQVVAFFGGDNTTSLTMQKYDDMQWVNREWLEDIPFVPYYSGINGTFNGDQYVLEFAHRARIFWDLASQGYNTTLWGGRMLWTNQPAPYENAIATQLYIASSSGMYLHLPGDNNTNPSSGTGDKHTYLGVPLWYHQR